jgi:Ca-activated chloride channel family protein
MSELQFQYPQMLWLLVAVPFFLLLFIYYIFWKKRRIKKIGDVHLVRSLIKTHSGIKSSVKFFLLILAFSLGCIALANPRKPEAGGNQARKGIDVMVALDVSNSMLAADVQSTRLAKAKAFINQMIIAMPENRFGLVLFAGQAYVQMPLTFDASAALLFIDAANPGIITAQGTAINDALQKSGLAFASSEDRYKAIVLITDGETHDEGAIASAAELASEGIMIHTVGIGSAEGAAIIDTATRESKKDASGSVILSKLNEQLLQQIATAASGNYIHLSNAPEGLAQLQTEFSLAEKKVLVDKSLLGYESFYWWFAIPMLLFLLMEVFFPDRKKIRL